MKPSDCPQPGDHLVEDHMHLVRRLVASMIRKVPRHVDPLALQSAAQFGLLQAARAYRGETGVPFSIYARRRIQGAMLDELISSDVLSRGARKRTKHVVAVRLALTQQLGRVPTWEELSEATGYSAETVLQGLRGGYPPLSLDEVVTKSHVDGRERTRGEFLVGKPLRLGTEFPENLVAALRVLPLAERTVVVGYHAVGLSQVELAEYLQVSPSRVSQLHRRGIELLAATSHVKKSLAS
jgi:RNA polymerase sigma factor for flagellar operon FliA